MGKFIKTNVEGSLFSPKQRVKYLDTVAIRGFSLPLKSLALTFPSSANSGGAFLIIPPDLLYIAEGYVENGYV